MNRAHDRTRRIALAFGVAMACWIYVEVLSRSWAEFFREVRLPFIVAGVGAMALVAARPSRWGGLITAVGAPTLLTGCFFIGTLLAQGGGWQWDHLRIAATTMVAVAIGATVGRVASAVRSGS